jgi:hypothetical protein
MTGKTELQLLICHHELASGSRNYLFLLDAANKFGMSCYYSFSYDDAVSGEDEDHRATFCVMIAKDNRSV